MANLQDLRERPYLQEWARANQHGGLPKCVLPKCATCKTPEDCDALFASLEKHVEKELTDLAASKGCAVNELRAYIGITIQSGGGRIAQHMAKADYCRGTIVYMDTLGLDVDLSAYTIDDMDKGKVAALEPVYQFLRRVERRARYGVFHRMNTVLINDRGQDGAVAHSSAYLAAPLDKAVMTVYTLYLEKGAALPGATRDTTRMSWVVDAASRQVAAEQGAAAPFDVLQQSADRARALDRRVSYGGRAQIRRTPAAAAAVDSAMRITNAAHAAHAAHTNSAAAAPPQVSPPPQQVAAAVDSAMNSAAATPPQVSPPQQQTHFKRAPGQMPCKYGSKCYRKDPNHWKLFDHPGNHPNLVTQPPDPPVPAATLSASALSIPTASASASTQRSFQGMIEEGAQTGYIKGSEMGRWAKRQKPIGSDYGVVNPRGGPPIAPFPNTNPLSLPPPDRGWYSGGAKAEACPVGTMWLDTTNPWLRLIRKNGRCACATCRIPRCVSWASTQPCQLKPNPTQPNPSPPPCDLPDLERSTKCTPCSWSCSGILAKCSSELGRASFQHRCQHSAVSLVIVGGLPGWSDLLALYWC
jgi:hypothetical protein